MPFQVLKHLDGISIHWTANWLPRVTKINLSSVPIHVYEHLNPNILRPNIFLYHSSWGVIKRMLTVTGSVAAVITSTENAQREGGVQDRETEVDSREGPIHC